MKQVYADAFAEIDQIFSLMPLALLDKIPNKFKQIIKENKSDYIPDIGEPIEECQLSEETIIILSLIYRDFLCTKEEKEKLQYRDAQKLKEAEEELREKYNPDNLFENRNATNINDTIPENKESVALIKYEEYKWYTKIFNVIKKLFKRN